MIITIAAATMMYAWSPAWYHWFKFSVPKGGDVVSQVRMLYNLKCVVVAPTGVGRVVQDHVRGDTKQGTHLSLLRSLNWCH